MPTSLTRIVPLRLSLLSQGTCVSSGYGLTSYQFRGHFSWAPRIIRTLLSITLYSRSLVYPSPGRHGAWRGRQPPTDYLEASSHGTRCRRCLRGSGILTGFPFVHVQLGVHLGPTNSRLKSIAEKPLPLRRSGFSPDFAVTTGRIFIPTRSTRRYRLASALAGRLLTTSALARWSRVSVTGFSPVHLHCPRPRRVICYELFKG